MLWQFDKLAHSFKEIYYFCIASMGDNYVQSKRCLRSKGYVSCLRKLYFLCTCGGIETSEHFFFECNNYDAIRTSLFNAISVFGNIDLEMLLYGKGSLLYRDNEKNFLEVQKFIKLSSRFPVR